MLKQRWDPSVKSLTAMPQVLEMMDAKIDWTQKLGDAFLPSRRRSWRRCRRCARRRLPRAISSRPRAAGIDRAGGRQDRHRDRAANPQVVYVPTYDPTVVYGAWPYPPTRRTTTTRRPTTRRAGLFWFGAGMLVGAAIWGGCNWGGGGVYINHHNYNNFNRSNIGGDSNWRHNVDHRKGVAYRDQATARQYNRDFNRDAQRASSSAAAGEAVGKRRNAATPGATRAVGRGRDRAGSGRDGASAGTMDRGGAFDATSAAAAAAASKGVGNGAGTRDISSRGNASRQSMGAALGRLLARRAAAGRGGGGRR
jgi:hypothetical protein